MKYVALAAFVGFFALRLSFVLYSQAQETLPLFVGEKVEVVGRVVEDPDVRERAVRVVLSDLVIQDEAVSGKLLVLLNPNVVVSYNDIVTVRGKIAAPKAFETDTGHTFDYPNYLRARSISAQMSYATLVADAPGNWSLLGVLFSIKHKFEYALERLVPQPDEALLEGILLGEKHGLSDSLTAAFVVSGLVHIIVLSGYNISIVAEGVFRILSFLPRTLCYGVGSLAMVFFALVTGSGATTVRALLMGLISVMARYARRPTIALHSLMVAAGAMVLWNPLSLFYDSSFILSVLATFGLITLSPTVETLLTKLSFFRRKELLGTRSIVATTVAVEVFVLPALLYFSGVMGFLSIPANVLVLPVIPVAMFWGFVTGVLGIFHPLLGFIPALVTDALLAWVLLVVALVASVPYSSIIIPQFSPLIIVSVYAPLVWGAAYVYRKHQAHGV